MNPQEIYLHPGDVRVSAAPVQMRTVLGSCVSVCAFTDGVGGMNHFLLPETPGGVGASARYGSFAIADLLSRLEAAGAPRLALRAKVFGGAAPSGLAARIGERNVELALRMLRDARIPVVAQDVGGRRGRVVRFEPASGAAFVKEIG